MVFFCADFRRQARLFSAAAGADGAFQTKLPAARRRNLQAGLCRRRLRLSKPMILIVFFNKSATKTIKFMEIMVFYAQPLSPLR